MINIIDIVIDLYVGGPLRTFTRHIYTFHSYLSIASKNHLNANLTSILRFAFGIIPLNWRPESDNPIIRDTH